MILFTNIASLVIDDVKNCLHVSGEITDIKTRKVFSFRGKATIISGNENTIPFHSIQQIHEQSPDQRKIVVVTVDSTEKIATPNPVNLKVTYHNLWKF